MRKKRKVAKVKKKKNIILYLIQRFLAGALAIFVLTSLIYSSISKKPTCANSKSCEQSLKLTIENNAKGIFNKREVIPPKILLSQEKNEPKVLGTENTSDNKHIYVDLSKQTLYAYEGKKLYMQTLISSGKWTPTPTGDFTVWVKLRATRMSGGQGDDYYDLPNVPYVMFFENNNVSRAAGYSLHGTYWHNNFGHPMSHGCINMRISDAKKLYEWINPVTKDQTTYATIDNKGTKITVYGEAPI